MNTTIPKPTHVQTTVLVHHHLTPDVITIRLGLPPGQQLDFQPGQFLVLDVGPNQSRSYSICSPPSCGDYLELCIKLLPDGPGSHYLRHLKTGDHVSCRYPFGNFILHQSETPNILFVATSTGLAPIHAMLKTLAGQKSAKRIRLLFGVHNEKQIFFQERLEILKRDLPNFSYTICLSRSTTDQADYYEGRVTHYLKRNYDLDETWEVYICGNQAMILDTRQILTQHDFPQNKIYTETFY